MKKFFLLSVSLMLGLFMSHESIGQEAEAASSPLNRITVSAGISFIHFDNFVYNGKTVPVTLYADYNLTDWFTAGVFAGYQRFELVPYKEIDMRFGARATANLFPIINKLGGTNLSNDKLEPYVSVMLGAASLAEREYEGKLIQRNIQFTGGTVVGARVHLLDRVSLYGEVGRSVFNTLLTTGVSVKL